MVFFVIQKVNSFHGVLIHSPSHPCVLHLRSVFRGQRTSRVWPEAFDTELFIMFALVFFRLFVLVVNLLASHPHEMNG